MRQHSAEAYRLVGATEEGLGLTSCTISKGSVPSAGLCDLVLENFPICRMTWRQTLGGGGDTQKPGHADRPHGCETVQWVYQVDGTCVCCRGWPTEVALNGRTYRAGAAISPPPTTAGGGGARQPRLQQQQHRQQQQQLHLHHHQLSWTRKPSSSHLFR